MTARDKKLTVVVGALGLFVLLSCVGFPGMDIVWTLAAGWITYLTRVVPRITVRWDLVASTAVYLCALVVGAHLFFRWLYRETRKSTVPDDAAPPRWKWRWTLGGTTLVLLMFVCGTAMVGIVHQAVWLARSPEPLYRRGGRIVANRIKCGALVRQIGQALRYYADENGGRLPDDLRPLILSGTLDPPGFVCPSSSDEPAPGNTPQERAENLLKAGHCSYTYLGKSRSIDDGRVVLVEPLDNHYSAGMNVLYGDGEVRWLDRPEAEKLLADLGFGRVEPSRH